jgi:hypothetical protein
MSKAKTTLQEHKEGKSTSPNTNSKLGLNLHQLFEAKSEKERKGNPKECQRPCQA